MTITIPLGQWLLEAAEDQNFAEEKKTFPPPLEKVVLRHPDCPDTDCHVCLNDALRLQAYLDEATGMGHHDTLGMYRTWLDKRADRLGPAETEHGWFSAVVFRPNVIKEFCSQYQEDSDDQS
jgi:hypothetical protein